MSRQVIRETIGARIRRLRKEKGWTQRDLADRAGIDPSAISKYERGNHLPERDETWTRLAAAFEIDVDELREVQSKDRAAQQVQRYMVEALRLLTLGGRSAPDALERAIGQPVHFPDREEAARSSNELRQWVRDRAAKRFERDLDLLTDEQWAELADLVIDFVERARPSGERAPGPDQPSE